MKRKTDIPAEEDGLQMLVVVDRVVDPYLVCFHEPTGFRAEQFRGLRNKLLVLNTDQAAKTLVVTSAIQGEGKSTTTLNLGIVMAELEDHQVLVAEFDFRRPSIERLLGLNPEPGLVELLHDGIGLERAIRPSGIPNLDILAAGARPSNPSELIASRRIDELLGELKEQYHYVLLDTPPVLPITDAGILSAKCDGPLLVVGLERAPRRMVR
ncbi:MAG TPA: CpsD/CapB family tyrosine-protein kinase, partial [Planctomycetota bacterium]|nr:CpsD/CapB family tyrosine-protein kinase [Planctomycetota bacterium]